MKRALLLLLVAGCKHEDEKPPQDLLDTGWFTDTANPSQCVARVASTEPVDGATAWYWRDFPRVFVESKVDDGFVTRLIDPSGNLVDTHPVWSDDGLNFEVAFDGGLEASATYTLHLEDCATVQDVTFTTDALGAPLLGGPESLAGKTWQLDLANATWRKPEGLGPLLLLYFTIPVLLGVQFSDDTLVDFIGAPGMTSASGKLVQDVAAASWDFPPTPFDQAPYFDAQTDEVTFAFSGTLTPVNDFRFTGTFAADGSRIGGGVLSGLADTRNLGALNNQPDDLDAICALAALIGTACVPCPDGGNYCLDMEVRDVVGTLVPGLSLQERD